MAKFKERESFETSQLERCACLVSFTTPKLASYASFYAITVRMSFSVEYLVNFLRIIENVQRIRISPHYCHNHSLPPFFRYFVVFLSHTLSFNSSSASTIEMARKDKNKTGNNDNNNDKNDNDKKTKTMTNDEDNKKREARKKRFAQPSVLDADADANIGRLFGEEEEAMEQDGDDDDEFGIGALFDRNVHVDDSVLESDDDEEAPADELSRNSPRTSQAQTSSTRPSRSTLRFYVEPRAEEVEKGPRYDWTPSKTAYGETPLTRRDVGCQATFGSESLVKRRELIRRHRSKKRARLEARIESRLKADTPEASPIQHRATSSSGRQEAKDQEAKQRLEKPPPPKRPRHSSKPQEDLRARLQNRQQNATQPQKRARIDPPTPSDADKKAQISRRQYKARKEEQPSRRQRKKQKRIEAARQQAREQSPQPSTSSGSSLPAGIEGYMARMREELLRHLEATSGGSQQREDRDRRSPSPFGGSGPKNKGKGKGKGKRD